LLTAVYIEAGEVAPSFTGQALKSESAATSADTKNADPKKFDRVRGRAYFFARSASMASYISWYALGCSGANGGDGKAG